MRRTESPQSLDIVRMVYLLGLLPVGIMTIYRWRIEFEDHATSLLAFKGFKVRPSLTPISCNIHIDTVRADGHRGSSAEGHMGVNTHLYSTPKNR